MYETTSLKGMEWKVLTEVILEMCGISETKGKRNCMEVCTLVDKTVVTQHNWLTILIMFLCILQLTIMAYIQWEPAFLLLEWEVTYR